MPVKNYSYDLVQNIRQLVVPPNVEPQEVCIHNHEHATSKEIFLGNADVTLANGMHAVATQTSIITLNPGDALYAITGESGGANLRIMVVTQH
jgi:TnpA family transposase